MADPHFETPRLAELYDPLDPDRADLGLLWDTRGALAEGQGSRELFEALRAPLERRC